MRAIPGAAALILLSLAPAATLAALSAPESAAPADAPAASEPAAASAEPAATAAPAAPATAVDEARQAVTQQESDVTAEKNLEEVFQRTEKQYSLLKAGDMGFDYAFGYSYYRDDRIDIAFNDGGQLSRFLIENDAEHTFSNTLSADYGVFDNLTFDMRLPLTFKYDTQQDATAATLGDVAFGARWQPFPVRRGASVTTLFGTFSTATGDSPYEIDTNTELAGGKGYYATSFGASTSKVIDPAVLFGSLSYTMAFDATDLNQRRGGRILTDVQPGDSIGFSMGLAYALSYDITLSASYQQSYSFQTEFLFSDGSVVKSSDSVSASFNSSVGVRMSPTRILSLSFGFGLTEDSPDVMLGFSLPIEVAGLKQ